MSARDRILEQHERSGIPQAIKHEEIIDSIVAEFLGRSRVMATEIKILRDEIKSLEEAILRAEGIET